MTLTLRPLGRPERFTIQIPNDPDWNVARDIHLCAMAHGWPNWLRWTGLLTYDQVFYASRTVTP